MSPNLCFFSGLIALRDMWTILGSDPDRLTSTELLGWFATNDSVTKYRYEAPSAGPGRREFRHQRFKSVGLAGEIKVSLSAGYRCTQIREMLMKTRKPILTMVLANLILLGSAIAPSQFAVAQFANLDVFKVPEGRTNVPDEHNNAVYLVSQSKPPPERKYAIFFVQTQGNYAFQQFVCTDAEWEPTSQSVGCSVVYEPPTYPIHLRETVTVGKLTGSFCKDLQEKHNPPEGEEDLDPIMQDGECHAPGKCSCYDIVHECRQDQNHDWEICDLDVERRLTDQLSQGNGSAPGGAKVPPSRGAGSGSN